MAKKKTKLTTKIYWIFMVSFLCAVFMYVGTSYNTYSELKDKEKDLDSQIKEEEKIQAGLNEKLELYKTDTYIEDIAREKLGYIKSNEIIYKYKGH